MNRYDDGELEISLAPSANHRAQHRSSEASSNPRRDSQNGGNRRMESAPQKKTEQRVGAYSVVRTLGEGSFGKVKLAVHRVTQQQVALKIIARRKLISRDMAGRVEREIEYLQLLRHPHIIKLYTVIKTPHEIIMVLEYAGNELFDYIVQHGKMREDEARRFFQQIICAVEYCHRHKIVHRDLKPENLLLDENLNVKIADFGLSNIMTDGNFLKTSCGSPNYAAPEVINGKLYAGPEVDVWSCGVILYVLLVGRLPFDDEHIPSLFAKIARGQYNVPSYMGREAAALIKKMLAVNPVYRATIAEIRDDPWFTTNLPAYLQPPVEEFIDTGVDPAKAINPRAIAPHASPAIQEKLHVQVTEKISKTMGYGIKDVQEALAAEEPSAIKDAYLIVRENKLMQANLTANLTDDKNQLLFQIPSPPTYDSTIPPSMPDSPSPLVKERPGNIPPTAPPFQPRPSPLLDAVSPRSSSSIGTDRSFVRPYVSKIGILPSSIPQYHKEFMETHKSGHQESTLSNSHSETIEPSPQTEAEKAETVRRLNPHSRSLAKLDEGKKPAGMTPVPVKKAKPTKWQFGIRSRNQPLEAIGCIYRALQKLGAEWLVGDEWTPGQSENNGNKRNDDNDDNDDPNGSGASLHRETSMNDNSKKNRFSGIDKKGNYKLPEDPWVLHVRWKKTGVYLVDFKCAGYETADGMMCEEKDVTSPFPFLDLASKLIIQLAEAD
ncbi:hypothetical protein SS1G_10426 [Sclerotinia sclerotiorum 1980 UF-70]|uniref:non-specific serine/threonine protein kinase n=1 Tax=Sclerotinia sclerotiorum (strain ATCC 18683 / 1980 / Ss-1) TaxID=665079 RepID=A7EYL0_SCLS1|nr:hypothetical protein SS1G_10426 [Sclerotinia sclerotiorum 1980 UF-70]EDN94552.1 hypothetical protein SS1G_10426 [Sclerotinia sclerotiorum 1980 UF-70]